MTKIYVGNLPFTREEEMLNQPARQAGGPKFFSGKLSEGLPTSVLPQDVRQKLNQGNQTALTEYLRAAAKSDVG